LRIHPKFDRANHINKVRKYVRNNFNPKTLEDLLEIKKHITVKFTITKNDAEKIISEYIGG